MRPVNLIPKEDRADGQRPLRGGPIAYVIVGALAAALIGVVVLVITGNQISERRSEATRLEQETRVAEAKAQRLSSYTQFHSVREQRMVTVASLANSRFDWERVMRELALVLPGDVWLTNLTGTANRSVTPEGAASISLRSSVPGPALEIVGCATGQDAVAGFVQALKDIDGVTRVGVQASELGAGSAATSGSGSSSANTSTCQTHNFIAKFQMVVAFDAAPVPQTGTEGGEAPAPPVTSAAGASEAAGEAASSSEEGG
jgi:Tfp pilus assembly protein PilN